MPGPFQRLLGLRTSLRPAIICFALLGVCLTSGHGAPAQGKVVAYCAQDQVYAERMFKAFQQETGIRVLAVYDSEAVKTVGLANRLLAEKARPQCDVFWGNEEMRTRQLAARDVFQAANGWAAFGHRSRRLIINTNRVSLASAPSSLRDLTNAQWQGKVAVAYPQFGTTATHFHALRQLWGDAAWQEWCRALVRNKTLLLDGNSAVAKAVGTGEAWVGLTDSDDVAACQREGLPVQELALTREMLLIPNTVAVIRGAPHSEAAQKLFEYLQKPAVLQQLVAADALEGASRSVPGPTLSVDWDRLLHELETTTTELNAIFLR